MKKIRFSVNGIQHEWIADSKTVLLDLLREDLGLTGAKQSCDRKGQCGACTVIINKEAKRACLVRLNDLGGAEVITIEGVGTPDNPHLIQEAFVLAGAVQCGFCTPGMIMAAKALLDKHPDPSNDQIVQALRRNLCRCTGYKKIIEAVKLAGRFIRGEVSPDDIRPQPDQNNMMGKSWPRPSAMAKACGTAHFTADFHLQGALELAVLRSTVPHARIVAIDTTAAMAFPGVAGVMTAADIKGTNRLKYLVPDRPVLCEDKVRYIGDPIVVVAAETRSQAETALAAINVALEPLPVMESPQSSLAEDALPIHDEFPNLCYEQPQIKGQAEEALNTSATVIEAHFQTQVNHQAPLEPEATIAFWEDADDPEEKDRLVIIGRSINIHYHLGMLQDALGWEDMKYIEAYSGGQFGIKIDVISEGIAGAAAIHFRRPVRYIPTLTESMLMTSKRHAFQLDVKLGADERGYLTAYCNDFIIDKGAYYSIGHVVAYRSMLMLSGSYHIPNVKARVRMVYTNNPWGSAARGAGPPQANFALECAMDMLADKTGIDPLEFRLRNSLQPGQSKSTGRVVSQWPLAELIESIRPHYQRAIENAKPFRQGKIRRGVGIATGSFGIGGPGDISVASVELDDDGGISIYAAAADPGEGNDSMLGQLTAQFMGIAIQRIRLHTRDTDQTAASGPAAGSRITYMIGGALINALTHLKTAMQETGAKTGAELEKAGKARRYLGQKKNEDAGPLDPHTGQGPSFESQVHAVQLAELEVDMETGKVKMLKMTTAVDAGPVINPLNLTGQIEGGMDMGVGYALREQYIPGKTKDWVTFKFPTIRDHFEMETIIRETPRPNGPLGATGIGEMCMVPTAPAVINAIKNATGVWIRDLPATPDKIKSAIETIAGRQ
ncbi:Aerobic-type carbon monoxide dehydrogenase, large subunit CoxL/CutL-like protein [Desulfosarcina cetonica]|uniref:molybdopterin-dependent oxidoreductase n=1 Tax=Desulfosarcina cetonica TaxID=90730 RepID=UPI0006CFD9C7|nr:molybdopterin cofactor-binding domain-containing protein [Desulfosarcina cetonica]VTR70425.1 Aerobic-type carbon monoxide dehydrogenase, large subunit CoxL/CutL-like protein [Desulfosarcina cetonica]